MGADIRGLSVLNKVIVAYGFVPRYIVQNKPKSEVETNIVQQALASFSQHFPSVWNSTRRILAGMGSSFVILLALNIINVSSEGFRFCLKTCAVVLLFLLGYEGYRKRLLKNDPLLPVTQQSDYLLNLDTMTFKGAMQRRISYVTSAHNFTTNAIRNCTLFGAVAELFSMTYLLSLQSSNGFHTFGMTLFGTTLGVLTGLLYTINSIELMTVYDQWKADAIANGDWFPFQRFVDRKLKSFVCPYSNELILIPANVCGEGITYEKAEIEAKSPKISFNPYHYRKVVCKIDGLLGGPDPISAGVKKGLEKYRETLKKEDDMIWSHIFSETYEYYKRDEIGPYDHLFALDTYHYECRIQPFPMENQAHAGDV